MNQDVGNIIKTIRKKNNLTQKELASKLGVTYQAVSKWETGKNIPDIETIKQISKEFKIDIDELLIGRKKRKNKKLLITIYISIIIILIAIFTLLYLNHNHDFEFKKITTSCNEFDITGSLAYNEDKTSIYISNLNYCGKNNDIKYKTIECTLYESYDNIETQITSCSNKKQYITLSEFLKEVQINVDNYTSSCKKFTSSNLYLEINAIDEEDKINLYKIPLTLEENCKTQANSTSS